MRLSPTTPVPAGVQGIAYAPEDHGIGWLHIGPGAFFRAHQAAYVDAALAACGGDWRIACVGLRSDQAAQALAPQGGLYSLTTLAETRATRLIGSVAQAETGQGALCRWMADPKVWVVSLTVTEKGYGPDLGQALLTGLNARFAAGLGPLTFLSCDNLSGNGEVLRDLVLVHTSGPFGTWAGRCTFPNTMVDRITPAVTAQDAQDVARRLGANDHACVLTEPFTQWVIEDQFATDIPDLRAAGVEVVGDVAAYETMKLRMLNGAHTALALAGQLLGLKTVREAMADPVLRAFVIRHMAGAAQTLPKDAGLDPQGYSKALIARFDNPGLAHQTAQIAQDTSVKLRPRVLDMAADLPPAKRGGAAVILALWSALCDRGGPQSDPLKTALQGVDLNARLDALDHPVTQEPDFRNMVATAAETLASAGVHAALS